MKKPTSFRVSSGLPTEDHRRRMGLAVFEFLWFLDRQTGADGWVLKGRTLTADDLAEDLGPVRTVRRNIARLVAEGYVDQVPRGRGHAFRVLNQKKFGGASAEPGPAAGGDSVQRKKPATSGRPVKRETATSGREASDVSGQIWPSDAASSGREAESFAATSDPDAATSGREAATSGRESNIRGVQTHKKTGSTTHADEGSKSTPTKGKKQRQVAGEPGRLLRRWNEEHRRVLKKPFAMNGGDLKAATEAVDVYGDGTFDADLERLVEAFWRQVERTKGTADARFWNPRPPNFLKQIPRLLAESAPADRSADPGHPDAHRESSKAWKKAWDEGFAAGKRGDTAEACPPKPYGDAWVQGYERALDGATVDK